MAKKVFIFSLVIACVLQFWTIREFGMYDFGMWAKQAEYVETGDLNQFDHLLAYGHPGGPIIEAVIGLHRLGLSYEDALRLFMIVFGGFAIASITLLCFLLKRDEKWWWPIVLVVLCFNNLYYLSTLPSIIVSFATAFLCLLSLYIYEKEKTNAGFLTLLGFTIGLAVSTRADIGTVMSIVCLAFIKSKINWQQIFYTIMVAGVSFILFDPFMWSIPIKHIGDLWFKFFYHYTEFTVSKLGWFKILQISLLAMSSMILAGIFTFSGSRIQSPLPRRFIWVLLFTTAVLYVVFMTSKYQAVRYFLPIITIWHIFLPLFILRIKNLQLWK